MAIANLRTATDDSKPSLIRELHRRYEASYAEYNTVEEANVALKPGDEDDLRLSWRYEEALKVIDAEAEMLRRSILFQVPTTDEELTVLAFHLWSAFDPDADDGQSAEERRAIGIGLDNLFDYLVSEGRADMEKMGSMFSRGAMLAYDRRRFRHANLDLCEA